MKSDTIDSHSVIICRNLIRRALINNSEVQPTHITGLTRKDRSKPPVYSHSEVVDIENLFYTIGTRIFIGCVDALPTYWSPGRIGDDE